MKLRLQETQKGEFRDMPVTDFVRKGLTALMAAIENETGVAREDLLRKGFLRGGELAVTAELSDRMTSLYARRMERLASDMEAALDAQGKAS